MNPLRTALGATAALALAGLLVAGCKTDRTKIGDIDSNPDHYAGKDVRIGGEVTQAWEMPAGISNLAAYRLDDGTGKIWVVSHSGAPQKGSRIGVKGTAQPIDREDLPILHDALGDIVEEHERKQF